MAKKKQKHVLRKTYKQIAQKFGNSDYGEDDIQSVEFHRGLEHPLVVKCHDDSPKAGIYEYTYAEVTAKYPQLPATQDEISANLTAVQGLGIVLRFIWDKP